MKLYTFHRIQKLPISEHVAWDFLSDPNNLSRITPPSMVFKAVSGDDRKMFEGQIIEYRITPLFGIPMNWVTEITTVRHHEFFVDEQRFGPYAFWHHKHFLKEIPGGVEMEDLLHYRLPMGFIGKLLHPVIKTEIDKIFNFRQQALQAMFGTYAP